MHKEDVARLKDSINHLVGIAGHSVLCELIDVIYELSVKVDKLERELRQGYRVLEDE